MPTILIIDDEQALRDEVSDWLQFEGYTVISAENGRVGLEMILREKPDLIIAFDSLFRRADRTLRRQDGWRAQTQVSASHWRLCPSAIANAR